MSLPYYNRGADYLHALALVDLRNRSDRALDIAAAVPFAKSAFDCAAGGIDFDQQSGAETITGQARCSFNDVQGIS
jgi:hypothetical protein